MKTFKKSGNFPCFIAFAFALISIGCTKESDTDLKSGSPKEVATPDKVASKIVSYWVSPCLLQKQSSIDFNIKGQYKYTLNLFDSESCEGTPIELVKIWGDYIKGAEPRENDYSDSIVLTSANYWFTDNSVVVGLQESWPKWPVEDSVQIDFSVNEETEELIISEDYFSSLKYEKKEIPETYLLGFDGLPSFDSYLLGHWFAQCRLFRKGEMWVEKNELVIEISTFDNKDCLGDAEKVFKTSFGYVSAYTENQGYVIRPNLETQVPILFGYNIERVNIGETERIKASIDLTGLNSTFLYDWFYMYTHYNPEQDLAYIELDGTYVSECSFFGLGGLRQQYTFVFNKDRSWQRVERFYDGSSCSGIPIYVENNPNIIISGIYTLGAVVETYGGDLGREITLKELSIDSDDSTSLRLPNGSHIFKLYQLLKDKSSGEITLRISDGSAGLLSKRIFHLMDEEYIKIIN